MQQATMKSTSCALSTAFNNRQAIFDLTSPILRRLFATHSNPTSTTSTTEHLSTAAAEAVASNASNWNSETNDTFYHKDLIIERCTPEQMHTKPDVNTLRFGHHFSDHMVECHWSQANGWEKPLLSPIHTLQLHPAAKCLHYATQLFEGMKAYRGVDNKIRIFRPELNMIRMRRSAKRACLPAFDTKELLKLIGELITVDQEWVPYSSTSSLYIRPTFIGTDATLGVAQSLDAMLYVVIGPVGSYYPKGFKPIGLYADPAHIRSWPGGCGSVKMGSNYAPTILIGKDAAENGCQQVLWLFGEDEFLTEVGTMNIFLFWRNEQGENELITPPLESGLILPGVTRQCLLDLTREWNEFKVSERRITIKEVIKALQEDRLFEMFGAGTACIVSPVDRILYKKGDSKHEFFIPTMQHRPNLMQRLFDAITDIQYGRVAKPGWTKLVVE